MKTGLTVKPMSDANSRELYEYARRILVGGVNSPVRAFKAVGGTPRFIARAQGPFLYDFDGNELIDYVCSWGALLFGHAHSVVREELFAWAAKGTSFGLPSRPELVLADLVRTLVPYVDMVRFVNSGSEATAAAIRLARGVTGRTKIVKCAGCYHGSVDSLLVTAGSGVATLSVPESVGIPPAVVAETLVVPYNDAQALQSLFEDHGDEIAAFIVEPIAGNMGLVPPLPGYLKSARDITKRHGALLIFDEVMTGFRVAGGGAAELYGVEPDLVCFGKIVGGGLPVGALGGRRDVMEQLAPCGPVYQAGTLAGNPLAMSAGAATLFHIMGHAPSLYEGLDRCAEKLTTEMTYLFEEVGVPVRIQRVGSMFTIFFSSRPIVNYADARQCDTQRFARFFHAMLEAGVHLPPSQFECCFLGTTHNDSIIDKTLEACRKAARALV
jgi:glutamate-1-semialdehyde 2,1-aminomutase